LIGRAAKSIGREIAEHARLTDAAGEPAATQRRRIGSRREARGAVGIVGASDVSEARVAIEPAIASADPETIEWTELRNGLAHAEAIDTTTSRSEIAERAVRASADHSIT
jgi:hypothetical protein